MSYKVFYYVRYFRWVRWVWYDWEWGRENKDIKYFKRIEGIYLSVSNGDTTYLESKISKENMERKEEI